MPTRRHARSSRAELLRARLVAAYRRGATSVVATARGEHSPVVRLAALGLVGVLGCFAASGSGGGATDVAARSRLAVAGASAYRVPDAGRGIASHPARPAGAAAPGGAPGPAAHGTAASRSPVARPVRPTAARLTVRHATRSPVRKVTGRAGRYIPTGAGMWIHQWDRTEHGNARAVVRKAVSAHLSTLYVRTGSTRGFIGAAVLRSLLPATAHTGIHVVAWDFPTLRHPSADAARLAAAARFHVGNLRVAAVAPDIETAAEGTSLSRAKVVAYLTELRGRLPRDVAILATVPWPSSYRVGFYPYAAVATRADAVVPMAYWYNNPAGRVTLQSVTYFHRWHVPVIPVGQGYDGRIDAPWLPPSRPGPELAAFLAAARKAHATGVSLWSWQTAGGAQWSALKRASREF